MEKIFQIHTTHQHPELATTQLNCVLETQLQATQPPWLRRLHKPSLLETLKLLRLLWPKLLVPATVEPLLVGLAASWGAGGYHFNVFLITMGKLVVLFIYMLHDASRCQ